MAELLVRHILSSAKVVKFNFTIRQAALTTTHGEPVWVLEIGTTERDFEGNKIPPVIRHDITESNIDTVLEDAVSSMCSVVDWGDLAQDKEAPVLISTFPEDNQINVPIHSKIKVNVKDLLPAVGIDLSDIEVIFDSADDSFDITSQVVISGDAFNRTISWKPQVLGA